MKKNRATYRITVEDESRLEKVADVSASPLKLSAVIAFAALALMTLGAAVAFLTPARTLLPGYLKASERTATEMQLLRLDSLHNAYETNAAFIANIVRVMDNATTPPDTASSTLPLPLTPDSLLPTSAEEQRFVNMMREREKYNISVVAPLAAESLMFSEVNGESVISEASKSSTRAEIIMAKGATIASIADGTVIAVSQTIRDGGATVIIQHPKGFLSRISRLGTVLVSPGDQVKGRQIIARSNRGNARKGEKIVVELWHNGDPLVPYEYINPQIKPISEHPAQKDSHSR